MWSQSDGELVRSLLVVNMRGMVNTSTAVKITLKNLNLGTRFRATIVPDTPSYRGMLHKVKEQVSWCDASPLIIKKLIENKGRIEGNRHLLIQDVRQMGYDSVDELANKLSDSKVTLQKMKGVKPSFALSPPIGGFKRSTRRNYAQGGVLGANPELVQIIDKMI